MQRLWNNFNEVHEFYKENQHLTIPSKRLRHWITYHRKHATTLTQEQLQALESIQYKKIQIGRNRDEEEWKSNFDRLISDPNARDDEKIKRWIYRQRRLNKLGELDAEKMKLLDDHIYLGTHNSQCGKRKRTGPKRDEKWIANFIKYSMRSAHRPSST